jgi:phage-related protein
MDKPNVQPLRWVGSSQADLKVFPREVRKVMGTALYLAQAGGKALDAKPLTGIVKGAGVLEVVEGHDGDTFGAVYTVKLAGAVYVLHAFQKKAKHGIATPKHEIDLIRARYEEAKKIHAELERKK